MSREVVLCQPEIPQNTGNIARTCAATGSKLTLVRPLGFSLSSKLMKRAGLDYWEELQQLQVVHSLDELLDQGRTPYFFSTKADTLYTDVTFDRSPLLIFGSETKGLPPSIHEKWKEHFYRIPMVEGTRSLNLSNSVAIVLYEVWRQQGFA